MNAAQLVLVSGAGLVGGFVNSIAGGGSLLLFPALVASGMGTVAANVTNSVALWPGYIGNVVALGPEDRPGRSYRWVFLTAAVGAGAGCALLLLTPASAFDVVVPFLIIGASLLLAFQPRIKRALGGRAADHRRYLLTGTWLGGLYGGYFGGGLGVILMALLGLTVAAPLTRVNALKGVLQLLVATVSLLVFALFGPVDWVAALLIAPLSLLGGVLGGRLVRRLSEPVLRAFVVVFGIAVGVWLAIRAFA
ncbi:MAG: sulfite exporter TauE/SafE family protein [Jatrophihabitantaceae bacterium]